MFPCRIEERILLDYPTAFIDAHDDWPVWTENGWNGVDGLLMTDEKDQSKQDL